MLLHPAITEVFERSTRVNKALRDGSLTDADSRYLGQNYTFVYKDGSNGRVPELGFARTDAALVGESTDDYIPFVETDSGEDRDGDIVRPMGCYLEHYKSNPLVFFGHQEWLIPIGVCRSLDGRITVFPEENRVLANWYVDKPDPDAMFVFGKVKRKILNSVSIAFVPIEAHRRDGVEKARSSGQGGPPIGWYFKTWDQTELSVVGVPSNPRANQMQKSYRQETYDRCRGELRDALDAEKQFISPKLQKAMLPYCSKSVKEDGGCWTGWCPGPDCKTIVVKQVTKSAKHSCSCKGTCGKCSHEKKTTKAVGNEHQTSYNGLLIVTTDHGEYGWSWSVFRNPNSTAIGHDSYGYLGANNSRHPKDEATALADAKRWCDSKPGKAAKADISKGTDRLAGRVGSPTGRQETYEVFQYNKLYGKKVGLYSIAKTSSPYVAIDENLLFKTAEAALTWGKQHGLNMLDRLPQPLPPDALKHQKAGVATGPKTFEVGDRVTLRETLPGLGKVGEVFTITHERNGIKYTKSKDGREFAVNSAMFRAGGAANMPFKQNKATNHLGEQEFSNYAAWMRAIKAKFPGATFEGNKDIASAKASGKGVGEWDGERGVIYGQQKALTEASGTDGGYTVAVDDNVVATQPEGFVVCGGCGGEGNCQVCDGLGSSGGEQCEFCGGSGNCAECQGVGSVAKSIKGSTTMKIKSFAAGDMVTIVADGRTGKVIASNQGNNPQGKPGETNTVRVVIDGQPQSSWEAFRPDQLQRKRYSKGWIDTNSGDNEPINITIKPSNRGKGKYQILVEGELVPGLEDEYSSVQEAEQQLRREGYRKKQYKKCYLVHTTKGYVKKSGVDDDAPDEFTEDEEEAEQFPDEEAAQVKADEMSPEEEPAVEEKDEEPEETEEPFTMKPSATVAAKAFQHHQALKDYLDQELPVMDHPGMAEHMEQHKEHLDGAMGHLKAGMVEHHKGDFAGDDDEYMKACMKSLEGPVGEDNLVNAGEIPPQAAPMEVDADLPPDEMMTKGLKSGSNLYERVQVKGKWTNQLVGKIRRAKDGRVFIVHKQVSVVKGSAPPIPQVPVRCPECGGTMKNHICQECGNEWKPGETEKSMLPEDDMNEVKDAGEFMEEMALDDEIPKRHLAPLKHHAKRLGSVHKALTDMGKLQRDGGSGSPLTNQGAVEASGGGGAELSDKGALEKGTLAAPSVAAAFDKVMNRAKFALGMGLRGNGN